MFRLYNKMDDMDFLVVNEFLVFIICCFICKFCSLNLSLIFFYFSCCLNVLLYLNFYLGSFSCLIDIYIVFIVFFV